MNDSWELILWTNAILRYFLCPEVCHGQNRKLQIPGLGHGMFHISIFFVHLLSMIISPQNVIKG